MRDETDLVARMRRGEQRAFDEFFDTYAERLAAFRFTDPGGTPGPLGWSCLLTRR